jgi:hypothetical protein
MCNHTRQIVFPKSVISITCYKEIESVRAAKNARTPMVEINVGVAWMMGILSSLVVSPVVLGPI